MMKLLEKYNEIMSNYRNGNYGDDCLTMSQILEKSGESDLFEKMNLIEIQKLIDDSSGITRSMFCLVKQEKIDKTRKIIELENELRSFNLTDCFDNENTDAILAEKYNLNVKHCSLEELPRDVEAQLMPSDDQLYNGMIMVLNNDFIVKFSFMHEIMHYIRDVGIGNKVSSVYTRKTQGNTDSDEEQEINYLAASLIMPIEKIKEDLEVFEHLDELDNAFWDNMIIKYKQSKEAIFRRFIEVRNILAYEKIM